MKILKLLLFLLLFKILLISNVYAQCEDPFCHELDSRSSSNLKPVGRIESIIAGTNEKVVSTGWTHSSGFIVSAGHVFETTPQTISFNVPPSTEKGEIQMSNPEDIYQISKTVKYESGGIGNDWALMWVYPNEMTGKYPGEVYGYLDMSENEDIEQFDRLEVYGYGADYYPKGLGICGLNSSAYTQQIELLSFQEEIVENNSKTAYIFATGYGSVGVSGAPVLNPKTGMVVGIMTSGYPCPRIEPYVFATSIKNINFQEAFEDIIPGTDKIIYINKYSEKLKENGSALYPFLRVAQAIPFMSENGFTHIIFTGTGSSTVSVYSENHEVSFSKKSHLTSYTGDFKITVDNKKQRITNNIPKIPTFENIPKSNNEQLLITNYPNPFNPETTIEYVLSQNGFVTIKIYNILGQEVEVLVNKYQFSGKHKITLNASSYPSGVYIYYIKCDNFTQSKKMVLIK